MEDIIHESAAHLVERTLLKLKWNIKALEQYTKPNFNSTTLCNPITKTDVFGKFSVDKFRELLQEVQTSLKSSFKLLKEFKVLEINADYYDFKGYYDFENIIEREIIYEYFFYKLRSIKVRSVYHVWNLNMIKLDLNKLKRINGKIIPNEINIYLRCTYFMKSFTGYSKAFNINAEELVDKNMEREWKSMLKEYSLKNKRIIYIIGKKIPPIPDYV